MEQTVYLDHNATAPISAPARDAAFEALALTGNMSSVHRFGRRVRRTVEDARESVAELVGAKAGNVIFTSGGTEANNQAMARCGRARVLASAVEHPSVLKALGGIETVPVTADGVIDLGALEDMLGESGTPALVCLMLANNETGVVQPVGKAVEAARRFGALVHCDAVQAAGKIPLDMAALGVDTLSLSAHKIGGPAGVGALIIKDGAPLDSLLKGGGQEHGLRAGTENVSGIAGFGAAASAAKDGLESFAGLARLRDGLEARVLDAGRGSRILGVNAERLPNTSCFTLPGIKGEAQVMALDLAGIAVSAGSACSSGKVGASHVLTAMGVGPGEASTVIRVSLGETNGQDDMDLFFKAWSALGVA